MNRPQHDHGTIARWHRGCHCTACAHAIYIYAKRRALYGPYLMPAGPVVAKIAELRAGGMGTTMIARAAGVHTRQVWQYITRPPVKVQRATMARFLAVEPRTWLMDATGTRRRLQALQRIGWTWADLRERGADAYMGRCPTVRASTAERVRKVYDELCMTPGPSLLTAQRAARRGWPPPAAWGDDIDDPAAVADTVRGDWLPPGPTCYDDRA